MGIRYRNIYSTLPGDVSLTLNMTVDNHVTSLQVKRRPERQVRYQQSFAAMS